MISGYIEGSQSLVDILSNILTGKSGVFDLFVNRIFLSMKVKEGFIEAFKCNLLSNLEVSNMNKTNLLIYCFSEIMDNPSGFFTFSKENGNENDYIKLEKELGQDELILQATLANQELKELLKKIISPSAVFRAISNIPHEDRDLFEGKNTIEIIGSSPDNIVTTLRKMNAYLVEGKIDIFEFKDEISYYDKDLEIDYLMEKISIDKINIIAILESMRSSKFSGILRIHLFTSTVDLLYKNGKLHSAYPVDYDVFDFLLNPTKGSTISLVSMNKDALDIYALRYSERRAINNVPNSYIELSKIFMGLSKEKTSALLVINEKKGTTFSFFKEGNLLGFIQEMEDGKLKYKQNLELGDKFYTSLIIKEYDTENISALVYLFMINILFGILLKWSGQKVIGNIIGELLKLDFLKYEEGRIQLKRSPTEEEKTNLIDFLAYLFDLGSYTLGQDKYSQEIELSLHPYKDLFKILNFEEFMTANRQ